MKLVLLLLIIFAFRQLQFGFKFLNFQKKMYYLDQKI